MVPRSQRPYNSVTLIGRNICVSSWLQSSQKVRNASMLFPKLFMLFLCCNAIQDAYSLLTSKFFFKGRPQLISLSHGFFVTVNKLLAIIKEDTARFSIWLVYLVKGIVLKDCQIKRNTQMYSTLRRIYYGV